MLHLRGTIPNIFYMVSKGIELQWPQSVTSSISYSLVIFSFTVFIINLHSCSWSQFQINYLYTSPCLRLCLGRRKLNSDTRLDVQQLDGMPISEIHLPQADSAEYTPYQWCELLTPAGTSAWTKRTQCAARSVAEREEPEMFLHCFFPKVYSLDIPLWVSLSVEERKAVKFNEHPHS